MSEICVGNCEGCPRVREYAAEYRNLGHVIRNIGDNAMSDDIEKIAPIIFEKLKAAGVLDPRVFRLENFVTIESPEDLIQASRASTAELLNEFDKNREKKKREAEDLAEGCNGPLMMRATRDGVTVTVTTCMSPQAAGSGEETVFVLREQAQS